jgi:spermidine synthase
VTLRVEADRRRPSARRLYAGLLEMSYVDLADPTHLEFEYMRRIGDVIDLAWPDGQPLAAVHLGGAACTLARYLTATRPRSRSDVYEHDERVLSVACSQLGLRPSRALRVRVGDARELLDRRGDASADLVIGDCFSGTDVPAHLLTVELAARVRRVLRPDGVYVLNVIDAPPLSIARRQVATLRDVFGEVAVVARPRLLHGRASGNVVLVAADRALPLDALARRAARAPQPEQVLWPDQLSGFAPRARVLRDAEL